MDKESFEQQLSLLPLYIYFNIDPKDIEFTQRVRDICSSDCPRYGKSWACPPATGTVDECTKRCLSYDTCLLISTITEVSDISNIEETLATRGDHEDITNQVAELARKCGAEPFVLSSESCSICERCNYLDGLPCRFPDRMHPCVESHGINILPILENNGLGFQYGSNVVTWVSLLFYNE